MRNGLCACYLGSKLHVVRSFKRSYVSFRFHVICDYAGEIPGIMKAFVVFFTFVAYAAASESCYSDVDVACNPLLSDDKVKAYLGAEGVPCNASYGHMPQLGKELIDYANNHIMRSYEYLMMATHYGNYEKNRVGFEKLFRGLSDEKWQQSIGIIKHITRRGGTMQFLPPKVLLSANNRAPAYELYELQSIAKALDIEKQLALQAFSIHNQASERHADRHDTEIATYIEKEFVHEQAETIRKLAGYVADLNSLLRGKDSDLSLHIFDEYLQK